MISMKMLRTICFLVAALCCSVAAAGGIKDQLVGNVWKMERHTRFMGDITTVWLFFKDGSGVAYQKTSKNNKVSTYHHRFTYKVDKGRVIVQEEIDEKWEGHYGVTRWRFAGNKLIHVVDFRGEPPTFTIADL